MFSSNRRVVKYQVPFSKDFTLDIPINSDILNVIVETNKLSISVVLDPDLPTETLKFLLVPTGQVIPTDQWLEYIGSVNLDVESANGISQATYHLFIVIKV